MTSSVLERSRLSPTVNFAASRMRSVGSSSWLWLTLICSGQAILALRPGYNETAFEDEGLYVYMGHRMIAHILHGDVLHEFPGSYFSGAPGLYPVLAAMVDRVGGLQAVRGLSLVFAMVATIATYHLGKRLFGKIAGLLGALTFTLSCGVIFQSHLATYDAMTMALVALAAWCAVYCAQTNSLRGAPLVSALLALAALTKYAGAAYAPMIAALAAAVSWPSLRWLAVRRSVFMLGAALVMFMFVIQLWGRDLIPGIEQSTLNRSVIRAASKQSMLAHLTQWIGPTLALAGAGALFHARKRFATAAVLLLAAVIGPLQQLHIGEATSLSKHTAFGMVFAAPLVGDLLARALRRSWKLSALPAVAVFVVLALTATHFSREFLTGWVPDRQLQTVLTAAVHAEAGKPILGEQPSPQRYELRTVVNPRQWADTYSFTFNGKRGQAAYAEALNVHYFGVIYLSSTTDNGVLLLRKLTGTHRDRYYNIKAKVPRYLRGKYVGEWLIFAPRSTSIDIASP